MSPDARTPAPAPGAAREPAVAPRRVAALPGAYSPARLARNLAALGAVDPDLARRLHLGAASDHVRFDREGRAHLCLQHGTLPLEPPPAAAPPTGEGLLLGIGTGELLEPLLARPGSGRLTAWERDPWLLRLCLMRRELGPALRRGRLRLRLGADILLEARDPGRGPLLEHPVLGPRYARERRLYETGAPGPLALLAEGGLLVEPLGRALEARGYALLPVALEGLAEGELDHAVRLARPELLALVNYTEGTAEFARRHRLPVLCWEIDPRTSAPRPPAVPADHVGLFTWRRASVEGWRRAGFGRARHLPLAADPAQRRPVSLGEAERARYGAPCALVGSSLAGVAQGYRARLLELLAAWDAARGEAPGRGAEALEDLLAFQRQDQSRWRVPERVAERLGGFLDFARERSQGADPLLWIGELAAAEKRLSYAANLGSRGLRVWGDGGWRALERHGVCYMGPAGHGAELDRIYCGATVNVDVGRLYQQDIVTMRVFDVLATGSFVLAEHSAELEALLDVGREVESYRTLRELLAKVDHYLAHPDQARAIAERGRAAVLERHRVDQRVDLMLADLPALAAAAGAPARPR